MGKGGQQHYDQGGDGGYSMLDETASTLSSDSSGMTPRGWPGMDRSMMLCGVGHHSGGLRYGDGGDGLGMMPGNNKRKQDRNAREQKRSLKISQQVRRLAQVKGCGYGCVVLWSDREQGLHPLPPLNRQGASAL